MAQRFGSTRKPAVQRLRPNQDDGGLGEISKTQQIIKAIRSLKK